MSGLKAVKLALVSSMICYGPMPSDGEEVGQRVVLHADGRAVVTRYEFSSGGRRERARTLRLRCPVADARAILDAAYAATDREVIVCVTDVPVWDMTLWFEDGSAIEAHGSVVPGDDELDRISESLREALGAPWLFAFDGGYGLDD